MMNSPRVTMRDPSGAGQDPMVMTVLGAVSVEAMGLTDAHSHVWIEPIPGADENAPVLNNRDTSQAELILFRNAGGSALVDCQPGSCGRNGLVLASLSHDSGVHLVACTGFHLRKYYPPGAALWSWTADQAAQYFIRELTDGLEETRKDRFAVRAGFIKVACEAELGQSPLNLLEGAAMASLETGAAIQIHTEKGLDAEAIISFFLRHGVPPNRLVLCHIDKRADFSLHQELAIAGVLLEYDTFYRPKYEPERTTWPLLVRMLEAGFDQSIAIAADFVEPVNWLSPGGKPGLAGLITDLMQRVQGLGVTEAIIDQLFGKNISRRLSRIHFSC